MTATTFDLGALERDDTPEPFVLKVGKRKFTLSDPAGCSYTDLLLIASSPARFLLATVAEGQREALWEVIASSPAWKVNKLADGYLEHYGLPPVPESGASPRP